MTDYILFGATLAGSIVTLVVLSKVLARKTEHSVTTGLKWMALYMGVDWSIVMIAGLESDSVVGSGKTILLAALPIYILFFILNTVWFKGWGLLITPCQIYIATVIGAVAAGGLFAGILLVVAMVAVPIVIRVTFGWRG